MVYDASKGVERNVPVGTTCEAVIIQINDGRVKDFIKEKGLSKFKNPEQKAIQVVTEGKYAGQIYKKETVFSYDNDEQENVTFGNKSALGCFNKMYTALPKVGMKVKYIADENGYFKLLIKV